MRSWPCPAACPARRAGADHASGEPPGSPARDQAQRLAGARYRRVCGSAPGRGLAAGAKGPNGPPRRDVGPQRPPAPHDKADDTKQPANSGGDQR